MGSLFLDLPVEIIVKILENVHWLSLVRCTECCTFLYGLIRSTMQLAYKIEIGVALLPDLSENGDGPVSEKLATLQWRENAWAKLRWERSDFLSVGPRSPVYELQHGFFAYGLVRGASSWPNALSLHTLPRNTRHNHLSVPPSTPPLIHHELGFDFCDFNFDPEQNLGVFVCPSPPEGGAENESEYDVVVRLQQLTDNSPHPSANVPSLKLGCRAHTRDGYFVQIFGDFIGVLLRRERDHEDYFWLYNWRTGTQQCQLSQSGMDNFVFLSTNYFMVTSSAEPVSLMVYTFKPRRSSRGRAAQQAQLIAQFCLPELSEDARFIDRLSCRCEPTPVFISPDYDDEEELDGGQPPTDKPRPTNKRPLPEPFPENGPTIRPLQDDFRVAVLRLDILKSGRISPYTVFVAISDLLKSAKEFERSKTASPPSSLGASPSLQDISKSWNEWGPDSTRFLGGASDPQWVCYIYMHRFVTQSTAFINDEEEDWLIGQVFQTSIHLLDFNPNSLRRHEVHDQELVSEGEEWTGIMDDEWAETEIVRSTEPLVSDDFVEKLETRLPYRRISPHVAFKGHRAPMLDAERIILLNGGSGANVNMEILVL